VATKKSSEEKKAKPRRRNVRTSVAKQVQTIAALRQQLAESLQGESATAKKLQDPDRQLTEALEQQTATRKILDVIASSPSDPQAVLDAVIANAVKLAGATQGHIRKYDQEYLRVVAHYGETSEQIAILQNRPIRAAPENSFGGRVLFEKNPIHVLDAQAEPALYRLAFDGKHEHSWGCPSCERKRQLELSQFGVIPLMALLSSRSSW
jgi:hypothetical protein